MKNMEKIRDLQMTFGKYAKIKVADIQRLYSKCLWLVMAVYKPSFADAELRENLTEDFVCGDFSGDGAQMEDRLPDLFSEQVGG